MKDRTQPLMCGVLMLAALAGCGGASDARLPLTLVTGAEAPTATRIEAGAAAADERIELRRIALPNAVLEDDDARLVSLSGAVAEARRLYGTEGDFEACVAQLGPEERVQELLEEGHRELASRVLFWRISCLLGALQEAEARRLAEWFATFQLALPGDVDSANPAVEALLSTVREQVAQRPMATLTVRSSARASQVWVDGRSRECVAPCPVRVPPGTHVVRVTADGWQATSRLVEVSGDTTVALEPSAADPELAGRQWTARYAGTPLTDSDDSLTLLARAVRADDLLVWVEPVTDRGRRDLRAAVARRGRVLARGQREDVDSAEDATESLLRELLEEGGVIEGTPLLANGWFWVAVLGTAAVVGGVVTAVLFEPTVVPVIQLRAAE